MTQLVLKIDDLPHTLADDAYLLHFAGNVLIGLESCISKEDSESFSNIHQVILRSPLASADSQDTEVESIVSRTNSFCEGGKQDILTEVLINLEFRHSTSVLSSTNKVLQFRPAYNDVIPIFLIHIDHHSYDPSIPSNQSHIKNICLKHGIQYQEWQDSVPGAVKLKGVKNVWKLIYNEDTPHSRAKSSSHTSYSNKNPLRYKYDPLFRCVKEILR